VEIVNRKKPMFPIVWMVFLLAALIVFVHIEKPKAGEQAQYDYRHFSADKTSFSGIDVVAETEGSYDKHKTRVFVLFKGVVRQKGEYSDKEINIRVDIGKVRFKIDKNVPGVALSLTTDSLSYYKNTGDYIAEEPTFGSVTGVFIWVKNKETEVKWKKFLKAASKKAVKKSQEEFLEKYKKVDIPTIE
jgi:hypothetical protein